MIIKKNKYDSVGYIASILLYMILIPQLYHIFKVKKMDQISWYFILLNLLTSILFLIYGILIEAFPIVIANIILCIQNLMLIFLKIKFNIIDLNNTLIKI